MGNAWCGTVPAVILAAALAGATAACGSGGGALARKSAGGIVSLAAADTQAASSLRMAGSGTDAGRAVTFDLTLVRGQGCEGTLSMSEAGTFQLVYLGQSVWMKPGAAFYASLGLGKAAMSRVAGKYIKVKAAGFAMGDVGMLCTLSGLLSAISPAGKTYAAAPAMFGGRPAFKITQPGHAGYAYVSDTARPVLLQVVLPGPSGGSIGFSDYNAPVTITPPPAAETIDGSQVGL